MDIERMKHLKEQLMACVECEIAKGVERVNTCEMGEVIDMVKDLSEALYYCEITKAMEKEDEEDEHEGETKHRMRYLPRERAMYNMPYPIEMYDPRYRERYNYPMYDNGKEHYTHNGTHSNGVNGVHKYEHPYYPMYNDGYVHEDMKRDPKEGRSGQRRKMYMEGKGMKDKTAQMKELETYMQELTADLTEMIQDASPEEKQMLQQKISTLATKIK